MSFCVNIHKVNAISLSDITHLSTGAFVRRLTIFTDEGQSSIVLFGETIADLVTLTLDDANNRFMDKIMARNAPTKEA